MRASGRTTSLSAKDLCNQHELLGFFASVGPLRDRNVSFQRDCSWRRMRERVRRTSTAGSNSLSLASLSSNVRFPLVQKSHSNLHTARDRSSSAKPSLRQQLVVVRGLVAVLRRSFAPNWCISRLHKLTYQKRVGIDRTFCQVEESKFLFTARAVKFGDGRSKRCGALLPSCFYSPSLRARFAGLDPSAFTGTGEATAAETSVKPATFQTASPTCGSSLTRDQTISS